MAAQVRVEVLRGSTKSVQRALRRAQRAIGNATRANREISRWLLRWVNDNFRTEGGKVGTWKPFKLGGRPLPGGGIDRSAKLLQDTGRLRESINPFFGRNTAGVGTSLPYAVTHEIGDRTRNIPARRMFPTDQDRDIEVGVIRIYEAYIRRAVR